MTIRRLVRWGPDRHAGYIACMHTCVHRKARSMVGPGGGPTQSGRLYPALFGSTDRGFRNETKGSGSISVKCRNRAGHVAITAHRSRALFIPIWHDSSLMAPRRHLFSAVAIRRAGNSTVVPWTKGCSPISSTSGPNWPADGAGHVRISAGDGDTAVLTAGWVTLRE